MNLLLGFLFFIIPSISYSQTNENKNISKVNYASFIMYHRFGDSRYPSTNIKKEQFESHINELIKPIYNIIDIKKAFKAINEEELINENEIDIPDIENEELIEDDDNDFLVEEDEIEDSDLIITPKSDDE